MNQGAHQTKYLRSLLKEELGLLQDVKVDLGGAYVDKALRDRSKQKVLQMFYREYLPRVVPMLTAKINEEIAGGNMKLYNDITHYISLPSDEVFSLDEEGNPVITEKGTIALLQTLGVLQSA